MSASKLDEKVQQLLIARDLYQRTGEIQEIQVLNLKLLPIAIFGDEKAVTEVDSEKRIAKVILSASKRSKKFDTKMGYLATSVQFILGDDFQINIVTKNKPLVVMFKLRRKEAKETHTSLQLSAPLSSGSKPRF